MHAGLARHSAQLARDAAEQEIVMPSWLAKYPRTEHVLCWLQALQEVLLWAAPGRTESGLRFNLTVETINLGDVYLLYDIQFL